MSIEKGQKLWLGKYALSGGIKEVMASKQVDNEKYISVEGTWKGYTLGRDIHLTHADAVKAAEAARIKKIELLRKQIAKLEKLTFEVAP